MDIKCIGCGALIQCDDENKPGFLPYDVISERDTSDVLCKRCHRLRYYHDVISVEVNPDDYLKVVNKIASDDALIVMVVDIFDFTGTFINSIARHSGQSDILLVGNKVDLLPKSVKVNRVINWMRHMSNEEGLKLVDASIISAKKGYNLDDLMAKIEKYRKKRNVYVVGCSNVGKSTLINSIIKTYTDCKDDVITTSNVPGTTLDLIEIELDGFKIIDTPGIFNQNQIIHSLSLNSYEKIIPKLEIKPRIYQLDAMQTLFIGGLANVTYEKGFRTSFVCYFANQLLVHRTKAENKDNLKRTQIGELLTPPSKVEALKLEYKTWKFNIPADGKKYDIVISGLGFINVNTAKGSVSLTVETVKNAGVYLREAII